MSPLFNIRRDGTDGSDDGVDGQEVGASPGKTAGGTYVILEHDDPLIRGGVYFASTLAYSTTIDLLLCAHYLYHD
jgi:hypothetical protein